MNPTRSITRLIILIVFTILILSGLIFGIREWKSKQVQVNHRTPLLNLSYCSSQQIKPCIFSFSRDAVGNMVITLLIDPASSSDFYLKVRHQAAESIYKCQQPQGTSTSIACMGEALSPGGEVQISLISSDNVLLAEGKMSIIGLAMTTPEIALAGTLEATVNPSTTGDDSLATSVPTGVSPNDVTLFPFATNRSITPTSNTDIPGVGIGTLFPSGLPTAIPTSNSGLTNGGTDSPFPSGFSTATPNGSLPGIDNGSLFPTGIYSPTPTSTLNPFP